MKINESIKEEILKGMVGLRGPEARQKAKEFAETYKISEASVYRLSRGCRQCKKRSTRGLIKKNISQFALNQLVALVIVSGISPAKAIKIAGTQSLIEPGTISSAWLSRWLKRNGLDRKSLKTLKEREKNGAS